MADLKDNEFLFANFSGFKFKENFDIIGIDSKAVLLECREESQDVMTKLLRMGIYTGASKFRVVFHTPAPDQQVLFRTTSTGPFQGSLLSPGANVWDNDGQKLGTIKKSGNVLKMDHKVLRPNGELLFKAKANGFVRFSTKLTLIQSGNEIGCINRSVADKKFAEEKLADAFPRINKEGYEWDTYVKFNNHVEEKTKMLTFALAFLFHHVQQG